MIWLLYFLITVVLMILSARIVIFFWELYGPSHSEDDEYDEWDNDDD